MKTALQIIMDVRNLLKVDELLNEINGNVYDVARPLNSDKQDITVSVLAADNEWMQQAIVNIRIHSPNPQLTVPGSPTIDGTRPDLPHFNKISQLICSMMDSNYQTTFWTIVTTPGELFRQQDGSWTCLVQLEYRSIQDNFKNI